MEEGKEEGRVEEGGRMVPPSMRTITWFSSSVIVGSWVNASIRGSLMTTSSVAILPSGSDIGVASMTDPAEVVVRDVEEGGVRGPALSTTGWFVEERDSTRSCATVLGVSRRVQSVALVKVEEEEEVTVEGSISSAVPVEVVTKGAETGGEDGDCVCVRVVLVLGMVEAIPPPSKTSTGSSVTTSSDTTSSAPTSPPSNRKWAPALAWGTAVNCAMASLVDPCNTNNNY